MTEPTKLSEIRADKLSDNSLWTPLDCVEAFTRDIHEGKIKPRRVLVLYEEANDDGGATIAMYASNVQRDTEIAMLHMRLHFATHKWERGS